MIIIRIISVLLVSIFFMGQVQATNCNEPNSITAKSKLVINESKLANKQYVKQLLRNAAELDQKIRSNDYSTCENIWLNIEQIDMNNTIILNKITTVHPWFPISTFGADTASDAWMIVQHSQDLNLQHKVLFIMEQLIENNEANKEQYALLYDRVALNYVAIGIKQKYGSQFTVEDNKVIMQPYDGSIAAIEERRKKFGMQPLHEYEKVLKSMFVTG